MAKQGPFLNADSSEEDSVKTDTTTESDEAEVYSVDRILYERQGRDNRSEYLLLWEGYPLQIASFEPKEHLTDYTLLKQWAKQKALIAQGKAEAFDLREWEDAWEQARVEKEDRITRRKAKRRRRGITVSSSDDKRPALSAPNSAHAPARKRSNSTRQMVDSGDSDGDDSTLPPKTAKVSTTKVAPRKRRGVATKVTRSKSTILDSSEGEGNDVPPWGSDLDSLFEGSLPDSLPASQPRESQITSTPSSSKTSTEAARKARPGKQKTGLAEVPSEARATTASSTTKKTGPAATAQRSRGPFTANWDKPKKSRADQAASHKTPNDTIDVKRYTLSMQNRLQKSGRNERPPDPSALTMIDPKTGKTAPLITPRPASKPLEQAKAKADGNVRATTETGSDVGATTPSASNDRASTPVTSILPTLDSSLEPGGMSTAAVDDSYDAYSRRTPQPERRRSLTPRSIEDNNHQPDDKHEYTCAFWLRGHCRYSAEECNFAHRDTGRYISLPEQRKVSGAKQGITCDYWLEGRCTNTADDCEFAHYDTGVYSKRILEKTQMQSTVGPSHPLRSHVPAVVEKAVSDPERMIASETTVSVEGLSWHQKKQITCFYWHRTGFCKNSDNACAFAHRQTGLVARDPTMNKKNSGKFGVPPILGGSALPPNLAPATTGTNAAVVVPKQHISTSWNAENDDPLDAASSAAWLPSPAAVVAETMQTNAQASFPAVAHAHAAPGIIRETAPAKPGNSAHKLVSDPRLRSRAASTTYHASLHVQVGKSQVIINASLPAVDLLRMSKLVPPDAPDGTTHPPDMIFQKVIVLEDLARIPELQPAQAVSGCIVPSDTDSTTNAKAVADLCQKCNIVYFVAYEMFTMLIYPQGSDKFSFMDGAHVISVPSEQTSLRLKIGPAVASLPRYVPFVLATPLPDPCDTSQRTDLERILTRTDPKWLVPEKDHKNGLRGVIIIMPEERATEMTLLEHYYQTNGCEVVRYPEDWEWFKDNFKGSGTIIVHRQTELYKISGLYKVADKGGSTILSFGVQMLYDEMKLSHRNAVYSYERLFNMGRATFITDDVFIYAPRTATEIIHMFLDKTRPKPIGGETGKIITRPSIKAWLQDLATNPNQTTFAPREEYVMLYQAICELCPPEHETRYQKFGTKDEVTSLPNDKSYLMSKDAIDPEWWWMPGLWDRDPTLHTDKMVEWFAGFSAGPLATKFRRMVIVHEPKEGRGVMKNGRSVYEKERDPRGWANKYQHLTVLRPKEWLATHK
nr:hypothetical protein CFP56_13186 [Quercus suber]